MRIRRWNLRTLAALSMLTALQVVLSRFVSISLPNMKLSFGFVAVMLAGALFGARGGALVGALSDLIGALLFPSGAFFPGYTLTAALTGALYGAFLHEKHGFFRILLNYVVTGVFMTLLLNSFMIAFQYGYLLVEAEGRSWGGVWAMFLANLPKRLLQLAVMTPVQTILTHAILNLADIPKRLKAMFG